jgi:predicted nucleic acid-binding Zn ribbon protein
MKVTLPRVDLDLVPDIFERVPIYVYKFIETGETIEISQSFSDETLTEAEHPSTGQVMSVKKVFQPVGVTFRGGGFYKNDSRGASSSTTPSSSTDSSSSSSSDTGGSSSTAATSGSASTSSATPASASTKD